MEEMIYNRLVKKEATLAVIGLGYVGLPIALEFARKIKVVGFDINADRVDLMKQNIDPSNELVASDFEGCDISFTHKLEDLKEVQFFIVAVPTPIDQSKKPKGYASGSGQTLRYLGLPINNTFHEEFYSHKLIPVEDSAYKLQKLLKEF